MSYQKSQAELEFATKRTARIQNELGFPTSTSPGDVSVLRFESTFATARGDIPFDIYLTSGMSDCPMDSDDPVCRRRELMFFAAPGRDYSKVLRQTALMPFEEGFCLMYGHTVATYGAFFEEGGTQALVDAPEKIKLPHLLFLTPTIGFYASLFDDLSVEDEPLDILWPIPISSNERALKQEHGLDALLDVFDEHAHPFIFQHHGRDSYV